MKALLKLAVILLLLASCDRDVKPDSNESFCEFANVENIDKTIPIVNKFLSGLSVGLNDEQQLQELVEWLKSQPCIVDAEILSTGEILISFATQRFVVEFSQDKPLKVTGYHEYEPPEEGVFCLYLNADDIDKTIPVVNQFFRWLSAELSDEQQLQELVAWLNSLSCIIEASISCRKCVGNNSTIGEILISFEENGITKEFIMVVSMNKPFTVAGYQQLVCGVKNPTTDLQWLRELIDSFDPATIRHNTNIFQYNYKDGVGFLLRRPSYASLFYNCAGEILGEEITGIKHFFNPELSIDFSSYKLIWEFMPQCDFDDPLTDLPWLKNVYDWYIENNFRIPFIYQITHRSGIGFVWVQRNATYPGNIFSFFDCEGNPFCMHLERDNRNCFEEYDVDFENMIHILDIIINP